MNLETNAGPLSYGADLIKAERLRQIHQEGWSQDHDDSHDKGELAAAAMCYIEEAHADFSTVLASDIQKLWPWSDEWWKPSVRPIRNLAKAGALIAAEIDRLQRIEARKP